MTPIELRARQGHDLARLYYEAHVTIEPPSDYKQKLLQSILLTTGAEPSQLPRGGTWRQATFSMATAEHPAYAFVSCRHESLAVITDMVRGMVLRLAGVGIPVTRWKIEDTLLDSRHGDTL